MVEEFVICPLCKDPERIEDIVGGVCLTCADAIVFSHNARRSSIVVDSANLDWRDSIRREERVIEQADYDRASAEGLRERVTKAMPDIAAAMPWYDESDPDYTEAIDAILAALRDTGPHRASAEGLREALLETAERAHKTGCRPIEGIAREFFNWDWWQCRNDECNRARAALRSSESDEIEKQVIEALIELDKFATWSALNRPEYADLRAALDKLYEVRGR